MAQRGAGTLRRRFLQDPFYRISAWLRLETERTVGHQPRPGLLSVAAPNNRFTASEPKHDEVQHSLEDSKQGADCRGCTRRPPRAPTRAPPRRRPARDRHRTGRRRRASRPEPAGSGRNGWRGTTRRSASGSRPGRACDGTTGRHAHDAPGLLPGRAGSLGAGKPPWPAGRHRRTPRFSGESTGGSVDALAVGHATSAAHRHQAGHGARPPPPARGRQRPCHGRGHRLGPAHRARLPRRARQEGYHRHRAGSRPPGRAWQGGCQGQLHRYRIMEAS